ncbi:hypothetical protein FC70_GL000579 [Paucilactobacillus oligofermentans DSM 15707 = LMG 22743]|uniref:HTH cro/C1-type domain-containing protein n=1 Tax=Paucilactobacillus oligofermentans DSM 15707 = LMG 22743 TaxID=1423778 RepID=A0A0R1RND5_9LACO|nr:helix-turn-helix transcriptional regulator [Paucilactobacillus oligofermentans]KRL55994.1 hypothetical protein FC70_GL000579 [Paucilactobacillus oligofermentans DSM 15707 = LMG 22743]CUS26024.1 Helix-turn-helix XRE-family transcriptional regulator [Paucilactobacillus oligofermentans DSM 15707 = LMG 22743]
MQVGKIIQYYRKQRSMTQLELAAGICTQGEISMIEKDQRIPSFDLIGKLSTRLEIPIYYFQNQFFTHSREVFLSDIFNQLEKAIHNRDYANMTVHLKNKDVWKNCLDPNDKQKFMCYKGIYINFYLHKPAEALKIYKKALQETMSFSTNDLSILAKRKTVFSKTETFLFSAAASSYFLLKKYSKAEELFDIACKNVDLIQEKSSIETLGTIFYNASKNLKFMGKYEQAIEIAKKGLIFEQERHSIYRSSELLFEIAESYYQLKNYELAQTNYIKSLSLAYSANDYHFFFLLIKALEKKDDLILLQQNIHIFKNMK